MDDVVELNKYLIETIRLKVISELNDCDACFIELTSTATLEIFDEIEYYIFSIEGRNGRALSVKRNVYSLDNFEAELMWAYNIAITDKYDL